MIQLAGNHILCELVDESVCRNLPIPPLPVGHLPSSSLPPSVEPQSTGNDIYKLHIYKRHYCIIVYWIDTGACIFVDLIQMILIDVRSNVNLQNV